MDFTINSDTKVSGCSSGNCGTGGCKRHNVFDWLADMPISFNDNFNIVEVSFGEGARKGFYRNTAHIDLYTGQDIVVEAVQGFDIGKVSLQGELVRVQMKKRKITERDNTIRNIIRLATEEDLKPFSENREKEKEHMIRARAIAKVHKLDMKIGDVEFQGDGKKLTIFYTANDRVDFRELVKVYAREFKVKIEMRQIGARQEAARLGGVGTCGRELCCSTWLHEFKSVTTNAVRYQSLALNTDKMSGQCGRLKCCLNYELDTYNDALKRFPKHADVIMTEEGRAILRKNEILKKLMWYSYEDSPSQLFKLEIETVVELLALNKQNQKAASLTNYSVIEKTQVDESKHDDLVGQVSLASLDEKHRKNKKKKKKAPSSNTSSPVSTENKNTGPERKQAPQPQQKKQQRPFHKPKPPQENNKPPKP